MASLTDIRFYRKAKTGEEREFVSRASVDIDGVFHLTVPDDLEDSICVHLVAESGSVLDRYRSDTSLRVSGRSFKDCKQAIGKGLEDWLACETVEELVIRYGYRIKTTYWKMPDGAIYANGSDAVNDPNYDHEARNDKRINGTWHGPLDATTHAPGYSVELIAVVAKRVTHTRTSGSKVEYTGPEFDDHFSAETHGERLNQFVGLHTGSDSYWHDAIELTDMPYSERAAKFFYDMLIGMCAFSDKIDTFFAEPANVIEAIESGAVPLIGRD